MEETNNRKEVTIVPPEGYEIDKENSTLEHIVFKKIETKPYRWRDDEKSIIDGYIITNNALIVNTRYNMNIENNYNIFVYEKQAKSALAMARISQIMKNDKRFGGVVTDEEWVDGSIHKYTITRRGNSIDYNLEFYDYYFLSFHTPKQRDLFLQENEDLVKDYLMIE